MALAVLHVGAAQLAPFGPTLLSMTAEAAGLLGARKVLAVHHDGWEHFTEGQDAVAATFAKSLGEQRLLAPGAGARVAL